MTAQINLADNAGSLRDSHVVKLSGQLDIRNALEVRTTMLEALKKNRSIVVDASPVTAVDTSIVQVLVATARSAERLGGSLTVATGAGAVPEALRRLGLSTTSA